MVGGGVIDIEVRSEGRSGRKRADGGLNDGCVEGSEKCLSAKTRQQSSYS